MVRLAQERDHDAIRAMFAADTKENAGVSNLAVLSDEELFRDVAAGGCVVATDANDAPVGMGCVRLDGVRWFVYGVFVRPAARGNGLGIEIVSRLHGIARDGGGKQGFVMATGHAEAMFSKAGYTKTSNLMELA